MNINDLDVIEQIHFINKKLKEGYSLSRLDKENIISSRKTIANRFKKIGYELNKESNQYESIIEVVEGDKSENKEPIPKSSNKVVQGNESENKESISKSSNKVVQGDQVNNKLLGEIILNYTDMNNKLDEVYEWYKLQSSEKVVNEQNKMIIPDYNEEVLTRSFKLYKSTQQKFADFCKRNSKYKVQDILCFLLDEGMKKYE
ncbi:hypothetical protein SDC9_37737 [bioreactor metagenome]|uniref:Uncharacterized protein n=1 Tax=bioreactor metagenome TaxID=1076179 RepID=A0A644VK22_9ZZZZ